MNFNRRGELKSRMHMAQKEWQKDRRIGTKRGTFSVTGMVDVEKIVGEEVRAGSVGLKLVVVEAAGL